MTIKKLSKLFFIKKQIKQLKERINSISEIASSSFKDNNIHTNKVSSPVENIAETKIKLKDNLEKKLKKLYDEELEIETFIDNIDDVEIQTIVRMRFIDLKTWNEIGKELQYDRTSPYYKIKNYLEKHKEDEEDNEDDEKL